jgi:beta-glucanase (GH16 family)
VIAEFSPGTVVVPLRVEIVGDEFVEEDEFFTITITQIKGADIKMNDAVVTLLNDDADTLLIPSTGYSTPESYPGMTLIWSDEYAGVELNNTYWTHEIGNGCPNLCGWGNNELESYRPENTFLQDGHLIVEARKEEGGGDLYTSSRIITRNKFDFKYGRVDIRANLPYGQGIWPALWMLGTNIGTVGWPACGEIDVMEMIGGPTGDKTVHGTAHWSNASGQHASYSDSKALASGKFNDAFHVFTVIWDASTITWYLDDVAYNTLSITAAEFSEFHNNHFFIFNVAVGGNWPGSPNAETQFPQRMIVDYIRVFQEE